MNVSLGRITADFAAVNRVESCGNFDCPSAPSVASGIDNLTSRSTALHEAQIANALAPAVKR